ncbi:hypothetical protein Tco_1289257 [Tanacetum coccineum]
MKPEEGVSIHARSSSNRRNSKPWGGPFLCISCQEKREAMEGKNHHKGECIWFCEYYRLMITNQEHAMQGAKAEMGALGVLEWVGLKSRNGAEIPGTSKATRAYLHSEANIEQALQKVG